MNVGIIVYSHTGNTLSVAQKLEQALRANGHAASVARVESVHNDPRASGPVKLKSAPDVDAYDAVIFASPVQAFSLAPVMKLYLSQVSSLEGKKVCCFVTQQLKKAWLGGNHAVRQIESACKGKGADIAVSGVVNWSGETRDRQIADIVGRLSAI
ncbi:MAG: flavodoxin domain-containing protein [Bacillota bacterium]